MTNTKQSNIECVMTHSTELGLHDDGYKMMGSKRARKLLFNRDFSVGVEVSALRFTKISK